MSSHIYLKRPAMQMLSIVGSVYCKIPTVCPLHSLRWEGRASEASHILRSVFCLLGSEPPYIVYAHSLAMVVYLPYGNVNLPAVILPSRNVIPHVPEFPAYLSPVHCRGGRKDGSDWETWL